MLIAATMSQRWRWIIVLILSIFSRNVLASDPYVVIILIDGARSDLVHQMAADGQLPHIQKLFIDGGLDVTHGLTVFPTTSTNAYQSFMTGLFSGHSGIPYLARFSRSEQESIEYLSIKGLKIMNADLLNWHQLNDPKTPFMVTQGSLFDWLVPLPTASVYSTFHRNATQQVPSLPWRAAWQTFVTHDFEEVDTLTYQALLKRFKLPSSQIPHLTLAAFLGNDIISHDAGATAARVKDHLIELDHMIGDFWEFLAQRHLQDQTYLVLVGDHGGHDIENRSYLRERLLKEGVAIRSRHIRPPYELAINARGVSCAIISVMGPNGWKSSPSLDDLRHVPTKKKGEMDLIDYLRRQPETDLLLVRNGLHHVRIFSAQGESEVTRSTSSGQTWYAYRVLTGQDPLHYQNVPQGTPLTAQQWLPLTANKTYADAVVQIGQIFADYRVGDIMIVPHQGWVFRHEKAATHGSLSQADMHIPIMMHGPTIAPQKIPYGRSVDVMPTILSWFGKTSTHIDGHNLLQSPPTLSPVATQLAAIETQHLAGTVRPLPRTRALRNAVQSELTLRQDRVNKLEALYTQCGHKTEDRLTRQDRPKRLRTSTCEVVDLALKTAYADTQRMHTIQNQLR